MPVYDTTCTTQGTRIAHLSYTGGFPYCGDPCDLYNQTIKKTTTDPPNPNSTIIRKPLPCCPFVQSSRATSLLPSKSATQSRIDGLVRITSSSYLGKLTSTNVQNKNPKNTSYDRVLRRRKCLC